MTHYRNETIILGGREFKLAVESALMPEVIESLWMQDPEEESTEYRLSVIDPEGWYSARIDMSGCVNLDRYFNVPCTERRDEEHPQGIDSMHICDIDDMIDRLQALKRLVREHYGEDI